MDNGGSIYIEGADVAESHVGTTFLDYLGCSLESSGNEEENIFDLYGIPFTFLNGMEFEYQDNTDADYKNDRLNTVDGEYLMDCTNSHTRVIAYDAGSYRVISSSIIIGACHNGPDGTRAELMARYLAYLNGYEGPEIHPIPSSIDFGEVIQNEPVEEDLQISNVGLSTLTITSITIDGDEFGVTCETPIVLDLGESITLPVTFQGMETGLHESELLIVSNDEDESNLTIPLSATVIQPAEISVDPLELLVTVVEGNEIEDVITIYNTGIGDLVYHISVLDNNDELDASGGPDSYGYMWIDSDDLFGPDYEWFDISTIGENTGLGGEDESIVVPLPFTFPFYEEEQTEVRLSTNGYLTFGENGEEHVNRGIPRSGEPNNIIAPFWDDLLGREGVVYGYHDTDQGRFILQYTNWQYQYMQGRVNFQVQLYENGDIYFYYNDLTGDLTSSTVGIEDATGQTGLQIAYNEPYLHDYLAIRIYKSVPWIELEPSEGTISAGESEEIIFSFHSSELPAGTYLATAVIASNDPGTSELAVPITLTVDENAVEEEPELPTSTALRSVYPNPFNSAVTIEYDLSSQQHVRLIVYNIFGQQVAVIEDRVMDAGTYRTVWDAAAQGSRLSSGVYFCSFVAGNQMSIRKIFFMK